MNLEGYEFTEVRKRDGKLVMIGEIQKYMQDHIDESQYKETKTHYMIECPYCKNAYLHDDTYEVPYTKRKLYMLKNGTTGFCFRCDRAWVNNDDSIRIELDTPEEPISMKDFELIKLPNVGLWTLDLYDGLSDQDDKGFEYLCNRNPYLEKLAPMLGIKYTEHNPVIPFRFKNELIYYQFRLAFGNPSIKYFSPPISHKPAYIIEHADCKKFIVCEGTFDAISLLIQAPDYVPFAVLGSTITDYQLTMLRTYVPEKILVYMDETSLSTKVADRIRSFINYAEVGIIKSDGTDPEENLMRKLRYGGKTRWIQ